jgi:site-specific DNA-methyltransferase (adenine-specific)
MVATIDNIPTFSEKTMQYRVEYLRRKSLALFQGDSTISSLFDREFADLIVTSPPYNVGIEYNSNNDRLDYDQYGMDKWLMDF